MCVVEDSKAVSFLINLEKRTSFREKIKYVQRVAASIEDVDMNVIEGLSPEEKIDAILKGHKDIEKKLEDFGARIRGLENYNQCPHRA